MNKKIKVIELLNLLAENRIKKGTRINYNNVIYKVDFPNLAGVYKENGGTSLYDNLFTSLDIIELNTEVEILEDEEIEEIKVDDNNYIFTDNGTNLKGRAIDITFVNKINEIIKKVNELDKKINKED